MAERKWPEHCRCHPGDYDSGWHEQRCDMCLQIEREQWRKTFAKLPDIVRRLKREQDSSA